MFNAILGTSEKFELLCIVKESIKKILPGLRNLGISHFSFLQFYYQLRLDSHIYFSFYTIHVFF